MSRRTPAGRVQNVARAACEVFTTKGYRRALMTDVGERLELSHAVLYRYVESKEALVELAVRYAMDPEADLETVVPVTTPPPGRILELVQGWLASRATFPRLRAGLDGGPGRNVAAELAGIVDELYDFIEGSRLLLLLIESLVDDYPDFTEAAVNDRRRSYQDRLAAYLGRRATSGDLRPLADPDIAAYFLRESVAWFAQHRKRDPDAALIDDQQARSVLRKMLVAAFVPDATTTEKAPKTPRRSSSRQSAASS